mmetsp:Transcript_29695/g.74218  ORF Transcript_29695/g.74218 Transcript_29695/m.74218 type:complete len:549 (-) Transcript_29695:345-1991(-)
MQCAPPNPPNASSWFQCATEILLSGALHPYSRLAQCHPSNRRSCAESCPSLSVTCSVPLSVTCSVSLLLLLSPPCSVSASASALRPNCWSSSSSITCAKLIPLVASIPSRSTRRRARSISASRTRSTRASVTRSTACPVTPSYRGSVSPSACSSRPSCCATTAEGSARMPRHGRPVRRVGLAPVPVMMEAPMSTGTENESASVCTRPPTRPRASSTITACPWCATMRAAARPAGPAPMTTTGPEGRGFLPAAFTASIPAAAAAAAAAGRRLQAENFAKEWGLMDDVVVINDESDGNHADRGGGNGVEGMTAITNECRVGSPVGASRIKPGGSGGGGGGGGRGGSGSGVGSGASGRSGGLLRFGRVACPCCSAALRSETPAAAELHVRRCEENVKSREQAGGASGGAGSGPKVRPGGGAAGDDDEVVILSGTPPPPRHTAAGAGAGAGTRIRKEEKRKRPEVPLAAAAAATACQARVRDVALPPDATAARAAGYRDCARVSARSAPHRRGRGGEEQRLCRRRRGMGDGRLWAHRDAGDAVEERPGGGGG